MTTKEYINLPEEALDDSSLSATEIYLLAQILRYRSAFERYTVNGLEQVCSLSKNTIRKALLLLTASGYLAKLPYNTGWKLNDKGISASEEGDPVAGTGEVDEHEEEDIHS